MYTYCVQVLHVNRFSIDHVESEALSSKFNLSPDIGMLIYRKKKYAVSPEYNHTRDLRNHLP